MGLLSDWFGGGDKKPAPKPSAGPSPKPGAPKPKAAPKPQTEAQARKQTEDTRAFQDLVKSQDYWGTKPQERIDAQMRSQAHMLGAPAPKKSQAQIDEANAAFNERRQRQWAAASQRKELTTEEWNALPKLSQDKIRFNTELLDARDADRALSGDGDNVPEKSDKVHNSNVDALRRELGLGDAGGSTEDWESLAVAFRPNDVSGTGL